MIKLQKKHSTRSWNDLIEQSIKIGRSGKQFGQSTLVTNAFRLASKNGSSVKYEHPDYVCFSRKAWKEQQKAAKKAIDQAVKKEKKKLEILLNKVYTELEYEKPPQTINKCEHEYNNGFYNGRLNAMEQVARKLFNKDGDKLKKRNN